MTEETCRSSSAGSQTQLMMFGEETENRLALCSGKMFRACSVTKETRSVAFLESFPKAAVNCIRQGEGGGTLVVCLDPAAQSHGGRSTPNFSAWPNGAAVCSLWQVLEQCAPEEVLFEFDGLRRDSAPCREKGEGTTHDLASCIGASGRGFARTGDSRGQDAVVACLSTRPYADNDGQETVSTITSNGDAHSGFKDERGLVPVAFRMQAFGDHADDGTLSTLKQRDFKDATDLMVTYDMRGNGDGKTVGTLTGDHAGRPTDYTPVVAFERRFVRTSGGQPDATGIHPCLRADANSGDGAPCVAMPMQVRRLTPIECERLQGLPDNWTLIPWRGKPKEQCPDGPRYKGIGNGQTVTVMKWLADRIMKAMITP